VTNSRRGGPGRPNGPGTLETLPPLPPLPFEERLREFAERLGAIAPLRAEHDPVPERVIVPALPPSHAELPAPVLATPPLDTIPLEDYLHRLQATFARAVRRVARRDDEEAIHDLRVVSRRLIAVLRVWRELFRAAPRRRALRALRSLRRRLGEARELEVHTTLLQAYADQGSPSGRDLLDLAIHHARRRLEPAQERAAEWAREKRTDALIEDLERCARRVPVRAPRKPDTPQSARARVARREQAALAALRLALAHHDNPSLHEARIAVKKWRYAGEALEAGLGASEEAPHESIRELQEVLGVLQDRAVLRRELLPEDAFVEAPEPLQPVLAIIERERRAALERFDAAAATLLDGTRKRA
jgi:CHAD domain-containing protein